MSLRRDSIVVMDGIPMTTTPVDEGLSDRTRDRVDYYRRLFKEDSPRGEFHRGMRDVTRVVVFGEEPPICSDCQEEEAQAEDPPKDD